MKISVVESKSLKKRLKKDILDKNPVIDNLERIEHLNKFIRDVERWRQNKWATCRKCLWKNATQCDIFLSPFQQCGDMSKIFMAPGKTTGLDNFSLLR